MCFAGKGQLYCFIVLRVLITSVIYFQTLLKAQCWNALNVLTTEILMSYQYYEVTVGVSVMSVTVGVSVMSVTVGVGVMSVTVGVSVM